MTDLLRTILDERRRDVAAARLAVPEADLRRLARERRHRGLADRLRIGSGTALIAEMKKASPSAGLLSADYRPADIARAYEAAGAVALSVLTESRHFLGDAAHLREARAAVSLPVLRKDFMVAPYQVAEAAAWGADVVLLIVAGLARDDLRRLYDAALEFGLEVLAEAHTEAEVEAALGLERALVGVNSRDLRTLKTDLATARRLAAAIPRDRLAIAESGIRTRSDITDLEALGYRGFLVGEALMRDGDPAAKVRELRGLSSAEC